MARNESQKIFPSSLNRLASLFPGNLQQLDRVNQDLQHNTGTLILEQHTQLSICSLSSRACLVILELGLLLLGGSFLETPPPAVLFLSGLLDLAFATSGMLGLDNGGGIV